VKKGLTRVTIIHGKGRSVKKREVLRILEKDPRVLSFRDEGYNWGATKVILEKKAEEGTT